MDRSGQATPAVKPRKELNWWHSFNSWWREEYDKLGRRPRMQEVDEWYHENAERIWGAEKPSLEATRDHAKCLRSKKELREYFQRYNAKKFGRPFTDLRQMRGSKQRSSSHLSPGSNSEQGAVAGGSGGGSMALSAGGSAGATAIQTSPPPSGRPTSPGGSSLGGYSDGVVLVAPGAALSDSDALGEGPGAAAAYHDVGRMASPVSRGGHHAGPSTYSPQHHVRNRSSGGLGSADTLSNVTNANSAGGGGSQQQGAVMAASGTLPSAGLRAGPGPGAGAGAGAGRGRASAGLRPPLAASLASHSHTQAQSHSQAGLHSLSGGTTALALGSGAEDEDATGSQEGPMGVGTLRDPYPGNKAKVTRYLAGLAFNVLGARGPVTSGGGPGAGTGGGAGQGSAAFLDLSGSCEDTVTVAPEGLVVSQLMAAGARGTAPAGGTAAAAPRLVAMDAEGLLRAEKQLDEVSAAAAARLAAGGRRFPGSNHTSSADDAPAEAMDDGEGPRGFKALPDDDVDADATAPTRRRYAVPGAREAVEVEALGPPAVGRGGDAPDGMHPPALVWPPEGRDPDRKEEPVPVHHDGPGLDVTREPSLASLALLSEADVDHLGARTEHPPGGGNASLGAVYSHGPKRSGVSVSLPKVPSLRPHASDSDAAETPSLGRPPKLLRVEQVYAVGRAGAVPALETADPGPRSPCPGLGSDPGAAAGPRAINAATGVGIAAGGVTQPGTVVPAVSTCSSGQALGPPPDPFRLPVLAKRRSLEDGQAHGPGPPGPAAVSPPPVLQPALTARESVSTRGLQPPLFGRELPMRESVGTAMSLLGPRDSLETRLMPPPPPTLLEQSSIVRSSPAATTGTLQAAGGAPGALPPFSTGLDVMAAAAALMTANTEAQEAAPTEQDGVAVGAGGSASKPDGGGSGGGGNGDGAGADIAAAEDAGPDANAGPAAAAVADAGASAGGAKGGRGVAAVELSDKGATVAARPAALMPFAVPPAAAAVRTPVAAVTTATAAVGGGTAPPPPAAPERHHVIFYPRQVELGLVSRALNGRVVEAPVQVVTVQLTVPAKAVEALRAATSNSPSIGVRRVQDAARRGPNNADA